MVYLESQLKFLHWIQEGRGSFIDPLFRLLNLVDTNYFVCSLIAFIWIGCSWRWGIRLAFMMTINGLVNAIAKWIIAAPRPPIFDQGLAMVKVGGFGFPSGGAQTAILMGALLIYYWKSRWAWPIGILYAFTISFSRIFLGVHFPVDVFGGWILGLILFYGFIQCVEPIEKFASKLPGVLLSLGLAMICLLFFLLPLKSSYLALSVSSVLVGIYISTQFGLYFKPPHKIWQNISLGLFGIFSAFFIAYLVYLVPMEPFISMIVQMNIAGLWISLFASPFCKMIFRGLS